jgi:biopolymer transport protein ExbB/biopolymer transport protein TolQ
MNIVDALLKVALFGSSWVLYLLLALSVISVGVVGERIVFFWRNSRGGGDELRTQVLTALRADHPERAEHLLRDSGTVEGGIVAAAMAFRDGGAGAFSDALESELSRARGELETGTNFLGTIGNNSPFIGLFGTVIGVIVAFHNLGTAAARAGAMGEVMSGIAEALIATGVGIFVALPAVIAYNMVQARIGRIEADVASLGRLVAAWIETHERGAMIRGQGGVPATAAAGSAEAAALAATPEKAG